MLLFNSKMNIIRIVIVLKLSLLSRQCMSFAELGVTFRSGNTFNNKKSILFPGRKKSWCHSKTVATGICWCCMASTICHPVRWFGSNCVSSKCAARNGWRSSVQTSTCSRWEVSRSANWLEIKCHPSMYSPSFNEWVHALIDLSVIVSGIKPVF